MTEPLFPSLADPDGREAIRIGNATLTYKQLAGAATVTAHELHGAGRVAVWAEPSLELAIAVVGALAAGVAVVPINPGLGPRELGHIVDDSAPDMLIAPAGIDPPAQLQHLPRADVDRAAVAERSPPRRARSRRRRVRDVHVGHDRAAQGRADPPASGDLKPRRAGRDLAVDARRIASPTRCRCSTSTGL